MSRIALLCLLALSQGIALADAELTGITAISAGSIQTCALTTAGQVKCWGSSSIAVLPVDVDLGAQIQAISRSCALTATGEVKCWGNIPAYSPASETVAAVSDSGAHACVLTAAGAVKCWGANDYGQLGNGTNTQSAVPVDVVGLASGVIAISAGALHTCALMATGNVKCWGANTLRFLGSPSPTGQLGDGTYSGRSTPVDVVDIQGNIAAIHAGAWGTCAVTTSGGVKCWGVGYGNRPVDIPGLSSGAVSVATNGGSTRFSVSLPPSLYVHSCALMTTGGVKCWGDNQYGQLGDGTTSRRTTPADVTGLVNGVSAVVTGSNHSCALTTTGRVRCWGGNSFGQLGDGTTSAYPIPIPPRDVVGLGSGVASITAGLIHSCATTTTGAAKCWGGNRLNSIVVPDTGALGDGTFTNRSSPVDVLGLNSGVGAISAGGSHTCAIDVAGAGRCWGRNYQGQLGDGAAEPVSPSPVAVSGLASGVVAISAGGSHSCALVPGGAMKCWGENAFGQLGDNSTTRRDIPVDVVGLGTGVVGIAAGQSHTCANTAGGAMCWGSNDHGQLGDNTTTNRLVPTAVRGLRGVSAIVAGGSHSCALISGGAVQCWGANGRGQLGIPQSPGDHPFPVTVAGVGSVIAIATGALHTCALTTAGPVKCWGANESGQLGDGTRIDRATPVDVAGLGGSVAAIAAGYSHTCARMSAGGERCWGANDFGQLGDGTITVIGMRPLAAPVVTVSPIPRLANLSTRMRVLTGNDVMIAGFINGGSTSKTVVINVAGPSLSNFGVANPLANPKLTLVRSSDSAVIATNDDWQGAANAAQIQGSGFAPSNPLEPAIMMPLPPGGYTAIVEGADGGTGVALVGVFEVDHPEVPLINISTRGQVMTGGDVMIAGFIVQGSDPQTVVINVAGPSLSNSGIANPLADPTLTLVRSSDNAIIATNDNWQSAANAAQIQASGFAPNNTLEPAIMMTLAPGAYTGIVQGVGGGTGVGLVGVFTTP